MNAQSHVRWMAPSPVWAEAQTFNPDAGVGALHQPAILRFAKDSFMEDFISLLEADPARVGQLRVVPETWRGPAPGAAPADPMPAFQRSLDRRRLAALRPDAGTRAAVATPAAAVGAPAPLKLYQPAHQRFYLVSACLVCREPGFPDRVINAGAAERVSFVVRRLRHPDAPGDPSAEHDPSDCVEYAFVTANQKTGWQRVNSAAGVQADVLLTGEEQLPLFPVGFHEDDGRRRRILAGLIPVGKREAYFGAAELVGSDIVAGVAEAGGPSAPNPRRFPLQVQVTGPWINLLERADAMRAVLAAAPSLADKKKPLRALREHIQTISWYVLLDLGTYLEQQLHPVWEAVNGGSPDLTAEEQAVVDALSSISVGPALIGDLILPEDGGQAVYTAANFPSSLAGALVAARSVQTDLEAVVAPYSRQPDPAQPIPSPDWPAFLFPLSDADHPDALPASADVQALEAVIEAALPSEDTGPMPATPALLQPVLDPRGRDWFVIRCVFERPACGPLTPPLVSDPTVAFELAGFFDADAPARPIRIGLPVDISPAGLRKADKNAVFVMSDMLCAQVNRMKGSSPLTLGDLVLSVLPWPFHKDLNGGGGGGGACTTDAGVGFGMICALSIPIITICALILLIIIVSLLDIIFHWLPFFLLCFPFPKLRAKESS